ncbi:MAG: peptidoglycan DD-metalloendopeptidase family protein [Candidatus Glassbacteria bacterium]|nr:peptidoglycan DD-metalloendopeptidase family protein [Candidatus Glassbacteria bacterium]
MRTASTLIKSSLFPLLLLGALLWRDCPAQREKVRQAEQELESSRSKLEQLEGEIEANEGKAAQLRKRELSLVRQIQDVERRIDQSRRNLKSLNSEISELNAELNYINRQLSSLSEQLERKQSILDRRLREIYKRGRLHSVQVLLESHSFTDFLKRIKYLTLIAAQDKRLVREVRELQRTYGEYRGASERKLSLRIQRRGELEREQASLERSENQRQKLLGSVKAERAEVLKILEQRKADRQQIVALIAEIERRRKEALERARREGRTLPPEIAYLDGRMGRLNWPVARGEVVRGFGPYTDRTTKTKVINNGLEIRAPRGEEVHTVAAGNVVMAEWYLSYGKTVMINHGSRMWTIYAHLSDVYVDAGDFVGEGQVIASVGETGSLQGPMLYFELRDGTRAVNPITWLGKK